MVQALSPQVVIMDISMPDLNGIEATRQILGEASGVKVIALSMHSDKRFRLCASQNQGIPGCNLPCISVEN